MAPTLDISTLMLGFAESSQALDEGFLSMDECSYPETSKHSSDLAMTSFGSAYESLNQPISVVCGGCGRPIREQHYLLADSQFWHVTCLRCALCGCDLQWQTSCFNHKGSLLCWQDYSIRTTCQTCERRFRGGDLVTSFHTGLSFHVECLRCRVCEASLKMGDRCFVESGGRHSVSCLACYQQMPFKAQSHVAFLKRRHGSTAASIATVVPSTNANATASPSSSGEAAAAEEVLYAKTKTRLVTTASMAPDNPQKRIRTSFKHDQLRLMKAYFKVNQNPDSKELRQLSIQTSLSKRVLQVWFQNARAKYRRWASNLEAKASERHAAETTSNQSAMDSTDDVPLIDELVLVPCDFDPPLGHEKDIV